MSAVPHDAAGPPSSARLISGLLKDKGGAAVDGQRHPVVRRRIWAHPVYVRQHHVRTPACHSARRQKGHGRGESSYTNRTLHVLCNFRPVPSGHPHLYD